MICIVFDSTANRTVTSYIYKYVVFNRPDVYTRKSVAGDLAGDSTGYMTRRRTYLFEMSPDENRLKNNEMILSKIDCYLFSYRKHSSAVGFRHHYDRRRRVHIYRISNIYIFRWR